MKELIRKSIVILVLMMMLINSSLLLIISKAVDAIENAIDESKINPLYEINLEKYVNYSTESETGTIVQMNLKTGIEYGEGIEYSPLSSMGVNLNLPKIEGEYPSSVEVIGKSTKATNGSDTGKDIENNYNTETGALEIVAVNREDENGNIYRENVNGARDEYTIILYYSSNCYTDANIKRNLEISGFVQANIVNQEGTNKQAEIKQNYEVTENISGLISTNVKTSEIYNGYISANSQNGTNYRTEYTENVDINISKKEISDEMTMSISNAVINKSEETVETEEVIYKSTRIDKNKILYILGQEGYLKIQNENGDVLGEVNKDTEVNENGIYEVKYENEINKIVIKTSKPIKVGTIQIENTREIKETVVDVNINRIQTNAVIRCINNIQETVIETDEETKEEKEVVKESTKEIYKYEDKNVTEIKDAETRIDMSISNTNWTNNIQNDITFNATLVANSARYNLFKNPTIEIKLPQEVEKVILGEASLVYGEGLTKKEPEVIEKDGCKVIRMQIEGSQVEYFINSMVDGVNVIIPATIIVRKDIGNTETNVSFTYTNENGNVNDYQIGGAENKTINVNIDAILEEQFMMKGSKVQANNDVTNVQPQNKNYTDELDVKVEAILGDKVLNDGDIVHEKQIIKYAVTVTNKSEETISGISIEGQVPEGTVYATVDIGSYMKENYSYVEEPDKKTVQITLAGGIAAGQTKTEFYEVKVNNLNEGETEKNISNTISVKIDDNVYTQETETSIIKKAEMEVYINSYIGREKRNSFWYYIDITNLTDKRINNVKIESNELQEELVLTEKPTFYDSFGNDEEGKRIPIGEINEEGKYVGNIEYMEPRQTRTILMVMTATNFKDNINECLLSMILSVSSDNTDTYISNENRRTAYPEYVTAIQELDKEGQNVAPGETIQYKFTIENKSKVRTLVNLKDAFSEFLEDVTVKYNEYSIDEWIYVDEENRMPNGDPIELKVSPYTTWYDLEKEKNLEYKFEKQELNISELEKYNQFETNTIIPAGKVLEVIVTGTVKEVFETTEVRNYMIASGDMLKTVTTNISKFTILKENDDDKDPDDKDDDFNYTIDPEDPEVPDYPDYPDEPDDKNNTYSINGVVWIDKNKDGIKQSEEVVLGDVPVKLYNADTNSIVVDVNNNKQITNTNRDGKYEFTNIPNGNYLVLFEYNKEKYEITRYSGYGKDTSSTMKKEVTIDGIEKTVGITDIIKINNDSAENINMGLIENGILDLKLDKYVSKVIVKNNKTKTYEYKNKQLAKVEIAAKQIENTQVEIEYKIVVTNEGNTSAYVDEIVDYLPQDLQFVAASNKGWTKSSEGNLVNTSLSGQKINAGESKELTLIVTKKMTAQNTGTVLNSAEINKTNSSENLKDVDSVEGNNNKREDDYSEASIIISIKTGLVRNIIIIMVGLIIIALIVIFIKKVKNKKIITFVALLVLITSITDGVYALNIKGNATAYGDDGNTYHCHSPNMSMCAGGDHYYDPDPGFPDESWISGPKYTTNKNIKIKKSKKGTVNPGNSGKIEGFEIELDGTTFKDSNLSKKVTITYVPNGKDEGDRTDKDAEVVDKGLSNKNRTWTFDINIPKEAAATKIEINIDITLKNAIIVTGTKRIVYSYHCSGIGGTHGSLYCHLGASHVQGMEREETIPYNKKEDKHLKKTFKFENERGNIRIIKIDKSTRKLVKGEEGNTTKFKVYYIDDDDNKYYIDDMTKTGGIASGFTKDPDSAHVFNIDKNGIINIQGLLVSEGYEYYLEEIRAKDGYEKPEEDISIDLSDTNVSDKTQLKRAMKYLFTSSKMRNRMYNFCLNDGSFSKDKYISYLYNICRGKKKTTWMKDGKPDDKKLKDIVKDIKKECNLSSQPTKSEIKEIIDYIYKEKVTSDEIKNIYANKDDFITLIKDNFNTSNVQHATEADLTAVRAYLDGYIAIVIENQKTNGWLKIQKKDADTGRLLEGATFWIYGTTDLGEWINRYEKTDASGTVSIEMKAGTYTIEEIEAPKGYVLEYQLNRVIPNVVVTTNHTQSDPYVIECTNKKYENLKISKVDKDTDQVMNGVGFRVQHNGQYMQIFEADTLKNEIIGDVELNPRYYEMPEKRGTQGFSWFHVGYTSDINSATMFITNNAGEIKISNLEANPAYYYVTECMIRDGLEKYYGEPEGETFELNITSINDPTSALTNTVRDMLGKFQNDYFTRPDIFEKTLTEEQRREHVLNIINAVFGSNLDKYKLDDRENKVILRIEREYYNLEEILEREDECRQILISSGYSSEELTDQVRKTVKNIMDTYQQGQDGINKLDDKQKRVAEYVMNQISQNPNFNYLENLLINERECEYALMIGGYSNEEVEDLRQPCKSMLKKIVNKHQEDKREETLLQLLIENYNEIYKSDIKTEADFISDLIYNGGRYYSIQYELKIKEEYQNIIEDVVKRYNTNSDSNVNIYKKIIEYFRNKYKDMKLYIINSSGDRKEVNDKLMSSLHGENDVNSIEIEIERTEYHGRYIFEVQLDKIRAEESIKSRIIRIASKYRIEKNDTESQKERTYLSMINDLQREDNMTVYIVFNENGRERRENVKDIDLSRLDVNNIKRFEIEVDQDVDNKYDEDGNRLEMGKDDNNKYKFKLELKEKEFVVSKILDDKYKTDLIYNRYVQNILYPKTQDPERLINKIFETYSERKVKPSELKYYLQLLKGEPSLRIENEQKWIDMSGYVWEDNERNKNGTTSASDGKYDSASENKVANILVSLKDSNGAIVLDKYGNPCSKVTDSRGNYKFENIPLVRNEKGQITNLASYHMEFQYDGFTYTSVILADLYGSNTSKAAEVPENRTSLNNRFAQVTQGEAIGVDGNRLVLNYDKSERKYANYINEAWKYEDDGSLVITAHKQNGHSEYDMLATTTNAGYVIQQGQGDRQYEITDINLGIKAREMPNALIYNHDVDNVKVTINGHTNVYKYDQNMVPANLSNLDYGQLVANVSSYKRWIAPSYIKSIQDLSTSDNELKIYVTYKITLKNASNTLRMNINGLIDYYDSKYKDDISVGTAIQTDQNQDNYYGIINNRRQEAGKIVNQLTATSSEGEAYGYKAANIQGVGGAVAELDAGQEANIYVQYEVKRGAIESVLDDDTTMNSVAEIYSFTTYYGQSTEVDTASGRQGQVYAAVDADSAPWNAQIGTNLEELKEQYENDTDISPGITLTVGNERAIEGNVFEDLPKVDNGFDKDQVNTDKERIGDGIFVPEEKSIKEILVELIPINTNGENTPNKEGIAYIYPKIDEGNTIDKYNNKYVSDNSDETDGKKAKYIASTVTDKDGKYEFIGIVPGHYQVKFSYGENVEYKEATIGGQIVDKENPNNNQKITVEKYKSTIRTAKEEDINYDNEYWYAYDNEGDPNVPRYSDALDDYSKRNLINKTLETIDYGKKTAYEKGKIGSTMDSNTNTMDVAIQNREKAVIAYITEEEGEPTGTIKNIDFGIIERPRQELKVEKIIKNLKITLANGQVLFDGNPKETTSQYVTYPKDSELVKIEIDNEILQGSTLEVKYGIRVTNLAERDYSGEEYYHYGRPSDPLLVKQTISKLLDYMDDKLSTTYDKYDSEAEGEKIQKLSKEDIGTFYKGDTDNKIYEGQNQKIDYKTYDSIKNNSNIIIIENDNRLKDLAPNSSTEIEVTATKILSTSNDNLFINNTEIIEEKNSVGRFTYSSTPGNYFSANTEPDGEREDVTVIPPTGEKNITQYIVIGTICLLVLTGGIILIKKKVLDS